MGTIKKVKQKYTYDRIILKIDRVTGDVIEEEESGVFKTHEQIRKEKEIVKRRQQRELERQKIKEEYKKFGNFTWIVVDELRNEKFTKISTASIARLLYLATYVTYKGYLSFDNGDIITKEHMQNLLQLEKTQFYDFFNEVTEKKHIVLKDNKIYLDKMLCYKGEIGNKIKNGRTIRLYHAKSRDLYKSCKATSHKYIAYIYLLIPFVNKEFNCICESKDIDETDINKMKFLNISQICDILHYDRTHTVRLKAIFSKCKFSNSNPAVSMVEHDDKWGLFVNPRLYYAGHNYKMVDKMGGFVKTRNHSDNIE